MKIRILTQNPFSVWFWWVEVQATKYIENIKKIDSNIDIDFFKWTENDFDILHIVWIHTWINPYWIDVLKSKWIKIVVSSVFYIKPNFLLDYRRPIIYKLFSYIPFHIINWMKQLLNKADIILPNSKDEENQLIDIFWISKEKIKVLHNWVDSNYFECVNNEEFKNKYNIDNYILSVSHIEPRKNHLSLIKGFLEYIKESNSDLKLVLFWKIRWNYFSYNNEVIDTIKNNKKNIIHIDDLSSKDLLFKSAYLWAKWHFLLSSLETPGLSNIEAWLCWTKLVLWECNPVKEYFWKYAKYIDWKNIYTIKEEIKNIDENRGKDTNFSNFIKNNYTWEQISQKLYEHYINLWKKK